MKNDIRFHAVEMLQQLYATICRLQADAYGKPLETLHGSSVGKHVRHIIEFFEVLDFAETALVVNYDERKRNLRLESEPEVACSSIVELSSRVLSYEEKMLNLVVDYGAEKMMVCTTLFRELVYNIEHCVHHLAIIKIGIEVHFPEVELDPNLGIAYSTQQFQKVS